MRPRGGLALKFRHLLEEQGLKQHLLQTINSTMAERGLLFK